MHCQSNQVAVSQSYRDAVRVKLDPPYQREAGIWNNEKKTRLIDSIFNKYDIPKFYFHDIQSAGGQEFWSVIDGKQRLTTIWGFMKNEFCLTNIFQFNDDTLINPPKEGDFYQDLSEEFKDKFKETQLDFVYVSYAEESDIEEIFERLNNGSSLNGAEKRRAIGGEMRDLYMLVAKHRFFKNHVAFNIQRYIDEEIAVKFLCIEVNQEKSGNRFTDLKKKHLDALVQDNKVMSKSYQETLQKRVEKILDILCSHFSHKDGLLRKVSFPQMYYFFIKHVIHDYSHPQMQSIIKSFIEKFERKRLEDLKNPDPEDRDWHFGEYSRLCQQATNDGGGMEMRESILRQYFLQWNPSIRVKDTKRLFHPEERYAIWFLADKACEECKKTIPLHEMEADHKTAWAKGGPTTIENAQCLCGNCNSKKGAS